MAQPSPSPLAGFVYGLPHQNREALCSSSFNGAFSFEAPAALSTEEAQNAFKLLTLKTPPQQTQPLAQPAAPPQPAAASNPQQASRPPAPTQQAVQRQEPSAPPPQLASSAASFEDDDDDDAFFEAIDVDRIVSAQRAASAAHAARPQDRPRQQPTQQQQQQQPAQHPTQQQVAGTQQQPAQLCSHGVAYRDCARKQAHLEEIKQALAEGAVALLDAEDDPPAQLRAMQEMRRLRGLQQLLQGAEPPAQPAFQQAGQPLAPRPGAPTMHQASSFGGGGSLQPYQQQAQQQQQQQPSYGGPPAPGAYGGTQGGQGGFQPASAYMGGGGGGGSSYGGPGPGAAYPPAAGSGYGAGPLGSGSFGAPQPGSYGGAPSFAGGPAPSYGGGAGPPGGGAGNSYAGAGLLHWSPDKAAMQNVLAERVDGNADRKWQQESFEWSRQLRELNTSRFGNKTFRLKQLQIMNCTLAGRDVFVLMPTGGGKSLCYQLPALLSRGVTIVVSPLVSLIQDQVHHLSVLGIPASCVGGSMGYDAQRAVYDALHRDPDAIKVLFITPEKLAASDRLKSVLDGIHQRGLLARVVVDEAHCDFRKDYTKLSFFKQRFPSVPLLALTATATPRVQHDVVHQLGIQSCCLFKSSFNRPNLAYEVRKKKKAAACVQEMADLVLSKYTDKVGTNRRNWQVQCGIVYCMARAECERVADDLEAKLAEGLVHLPPGRRRVKHYHASLSTEEREAVQAEWTNGDVPIIVATIAFGMGINKSDVRYVFHYSLPKSLEGYLQEGGRAGRDGRPSTCVLFYTYADAAKSRHMIKTSAQENNSPEEQTRSNMESLNAMIAYCEETVECRRVMLLTHFGETDFTAAQCKGTCDNCAHNAGQSFTYEDVSEAAKKVVEVVRCLGSGSFGLTHVVDVFRGNNTVGVRKHRHEGLPVHGLGRGITKNNGEAERLVRKMVVQGILVEETHRNDVHMAVVATLRVDEGKARELAAGRLALRIPALSRAGAVVPSAPAAAAAADNGAPAGQGLPKPKASAAAGGRKIPGARPLKLTTRPAAAAGAGGTGGSAPSWAGAMDDDPIDLCSDGEEGASKLRVALAKEAMHQLNGALRKHRNTVRGPFNGAVQTSLAALLPRSVEELSGMTVSNVSDHMKRQFGRHIVAAIQQAVAYAALVQAGSAPMEEFQLNTDVMLKEDEAAAQSKRQRVEGWDDDSDEEDLWLAAEPVVKQQKTGGGPSQQGGGAAPAGGRGPAANLEGYRCTAPSAGRGEGSMRPPQQQQQQQQQQGGGGGGGSGRRVPASFNSGQQMQGAPWPQQQQQQQPYRAAGGALRAGQPSGQQQAQPQFQAAGQFGAPAGGGYGHAGGYGGPAARPAARDNSPEWITKKPPAPKRGGPPAQQQQQQQQGAVHSVQINVSDAFGGAPSWGGPPHKKGA